MERIRAALFDHRRALATALTVLAVLAAVRATQPDDTGVPVVVAARDLDSGHVLTSADLAEVSVRPSVRPSHALSAGDAAGRRVAGPLRAGEPLTDRRVIDPRDLSGYGADAALTMVRLDDPTIAAGLRVGDVVDVIATDLDEQAGARVVAPGASIALLPRGGDLSSDAVSLGVVTDRAVALDLAAAAVDTRLSVIVSS